jgi:hypothetical protein
MRRICQGDGGRRGANARMMILATTDRRRRIESNGRRWTKSSGGEVRGFPFIIGRNIIDGSTRMHRRRRHRTKTKCSNITSPNVWLGIKETEEEE